MKFVAPLDKRLTQAVGNEVQAYTGERGLSGSPMQVASVEAQALAPYEQQNLATGMQTAAQGLGAAGGMLGDPTDISGSLADFMKAVQQRQAAKQNAGYGPNYDPNLPMTPGEIQWPDMPAPYSNMIGQLPSTGPGPDWGSIFGVPAMPTLGAS
jgi:hypothetical protein